MEKIKEEYKSAIKYFYKNKLFIVVIILVYILSFGFTITNSSIGMDDTAFDRYYNEKEMLGIGRWSAYLVYKVLNVTEFVPFWLDFIASFVIMATAILWCIFLKKNFKDKISMGTYIAFSTIFISFPIINEIFIFGNCNIAVMLGSFLGSLGIMIFYENYNYVHKKNLYLLSLLSILLAIPMFEACTQIILVSICVTSLMMIYINKTNVKETIKYFVIALSIFIIAIILNSIIVKFICSYIIAPSEAAEKGINWGKYSIKDSFMNFVIFIKEALCNSIYFPVLMFNVASVVGLEIAIEQSYSKKNPMILIIFIAIFMSNFAISFIKLDYVLYRTCTSWGLFVALIFASAYQSLRKFKVTKILAIIFISIIVLQQTRCINELFYNDYIRYQKDLRISSDLIYKLEKEYNISKPLVIMGTPYKSTGKNGSQSNSLSVLWWGQKAWNDKGSEFIKFLNMQGYKFKNPTDEQYKKGEIEARNMCKYPKEGSIKELDDCIVINF